MKILTDHLILYDAECPMCKIYTRAFVSQKMLDENGRAAYQNMTDDICPLIDRRRAVNEIALINTQSGEVTYGVKSLFKVIAHRFTFLKPLFNFPPFVWLAEKSYAFVSYNRRVIVPGRPSAFPFQLAVKASYRMAYLAFAWLLTAVILSAYAPLLQDLVPVGGPYREYLICGGQIVFQTLVLLFLPAKKLWDYLGNMMTISLAGALLLLPVLLLDSLFDEQPLFYTLYFLAVAGLMFLEHLRRCKLLGLGWLPSLSWVSYRLLVLILIFSIG